MVKVLAQGREIFIPTEFCLMDGVPSQIKNSSQDMRQLLNKVKQNPQEKLQKIDEMIQKLQMVDLWKKWDIQIEKEAQVIDSRKLAIPELIHKEGDDARLFVNERLLKQMPVYDSKNLNSTTIVLLHDNAVYQDVVRNT